MSTPAGQIRSFVALGDSFTEGLEDELGPNGRHLGWADRVADAVALCSGSLRYANLAVRGRLLDQVTAEQVPIAIDLVPDLVSFHAGPNDVLTPKVDLDGVLGRYEAAVSRLRSARSQVLLFTVVGRVGGTGRTADRLAARFGAFNEGVRDVASRHGCLVADLGRIPALQDRRLWHEDRLHLAPQGHKRVAAVVLETLGVTDVRLLGGEPGWWSHPIHPGPESTRRGDLASDVRWVRLYLLPWVGRRLRGVSSGDRVQPKYAELFEVKTADR